eukprot:6391291-Alexandrium_andersonii.AAC.1
MLNCGRRLPHCRRRAWGRAGPRARLAPAAGFRWWSIRFPPSCTGSRSGRTSGRRPCAPAARGEQEWPLRPG